LDRASELFAGSLGRKTPDVTWLKKAEVRKKNDNGYWSSALLLFAFGGLQHHHNKQLVSQCHLKYEQSTYVTSFIENVLGLDFSIAGVALTYSYKISEYN
jgi:hypothetical protein